MNQEDRAFKDCQRRGCDIIVKWTKRNGRDLYEFYDIGKFAKRTCKQASVDSAVVIWKKSNNRYINELNSTSQGF